MTTAIDLVQRVGAPNLGVMFDTWHFVRSGGSIEDLAGLALGIVIGTQVSDAPAGAGGGNYVPMIDRQLPGDGTLPLGSMVRALLATNPALRIGIEVFQRQLRRIGPRPPRGERPRLSSRSWTSWADPATRLSGRRLSAGQTAQAAPRPE